MMKTLNALIGGVMSDTERKSWEPSEHETFQITITYHKGFKHFSFKLENPRLSPEYPYGISEEEIAEIRNSLPKSKWTMVVRKAKTTSQRIV